jgi:hypothetical protein
VGFIRGARGWASSPSGRDARQSGRREYRGGGGVATHHIVRDAMPSSTMKGAGERREGYPGGEGDAPTCFSDAMQRSTMRLLDGRGKGR